LSAGKNVDDAQATVDQAVKNLRLHGGKRSGSLASETIFRSADKELKELRGFENATRADTSKSPADRATSIKAIRDRMLAVQERARQDYRALRQGADA
jgi:hypothetical protein